MVDDQLIARLLGTVYAAPAAPKLWQKFLFEMSTAIGAANAALLGHDLEAKAHQVFGRFGEGVIQSADQYSALYGEQDEWAKRGSPRLQLDRVFLGTHVWPDAEFLRGQFYNEFLKRFDMRSVACVGMGNSPKVFQTLTIFGTNASPDFGPDQIEVLQFLLPHLRVAMATTRRLAELESRVGSLENALNLLESALVLLDTSGQVVLANDTARAILGQGNELRLKEKQLMASSVTESTQLRNLVTKSIATSRGKGTHGGGVMPIHRAGKKALLLLVSPLRSEDGSLPGRAVVAVFLRDPERQPVLPTEVLRTLFGLTTAEARLAVTLMEGHSLSGASELRGLSRETVKSQMSAIFAKTGTKRQGELLLLLSRVPAFATKS